MIRRPALHAAGLSVYLCLVLWMQRTGGSRFYMIDLLGSCIIALAVVGAAWLASGKLTRDTDRRGLIAMVVGLWGVLFSTFQVAAVGVFGPWFQSQAIAVPIWTLLAGIACALISRGKSSFAFITRALTIATIILLAMQSFRVAQAAFDRKAAAKFTDRRHGKWPDVHVIIVDKYSSGAWLAHTYGLDHRPFEDSLRALGFAVPTAAKANYAHTQLALASFLNSRYFNASDDAEALSSEKLHEHIATAALWDAFRAKGYRIINFPSTYPATRTIRTADIELRPMPRHSARFGKTWWVNSPLTSLKLGPCLGECAPGSPTPYPTETLADLEWKLAMLRSLSDSAGPVMTFMHLLAPHEPYLFDERCAPRVPWWPLSDQAENFDDVGKAYAIQVGCLDRILLTTVRALLARPGVRPVIILQADHGHGRITVDPLKGFTLTAAELSRAQLGERLRIFAAYLFPGADTAVYEDISPVNVLPLVLRSIFGTPAVRQPDRSLWSTYQDPFTFTEIAPELTRPPGATAGAGSTATRSR